MTNDAAKLLIVDDDRMMLDFGERALGSLGYPCATAADAETAMELLGEDREIRVLITDMRLGRGPDGAQLAREALLVRPDLGVLLTSGDAGLLREAAEDMPQAELLPKPYRRAELAERLSRLLSRP